MQQFKIRASATPRRTFLARGGQPPRTPFVVEGPGGRRYSITETREITPIDHHDRADRQFSFVVSEGSEELPSIGALTVVAPLPSPG